MLATRLFLLLILRTILALNSSCPTSYKLSQSPANCQFFMTYSNQTCQQFTFDKCEYDGCMHLGTFEGCVQYQRFSSTDWQKCTHRCCYDKLEYHQNWQGIHYCEDLLIQNSNGLIVAVVLPSLLLIIAFFCNRKVCQIYCKAFRKCCASIFTYIINILTCKCFKNQNPQLMHQEIIVQSQLQIEVSKKWLMENNEMQRKCLKCTEPEPKIVFQPCKHAFHDQCLSKTTIKICTCQFCCKKPDKIKVYCRKCQQYYYETTTVPQIQEKCQQCMNRPDR